VGRPGLLDESLEEGSVEDLVARVQLEADLDVVVAGQSVDLLLSLKRSRYSSQAVGEARRASAEQCGEGVNHPTLSSAPVPASLRTSRVSGRERAWRQAV